MKLKPLYSLLLLALAACNQTPAPVEDTKMSVEDSIAETHKDHYTLKYKGTLPCADCPGIIMELALWDDSLNYKEKMTYIDRPDTFRREGLYTVRRGYKSDYNKALYILDDEPGKNRTAYWVYNDSTLLLLDKGEEVIEESEKFMLHLQR